MENSEVKKFIINIILILLGVLLIIGCFFLGKTLGSKSISDDPSSNNETISNNKTTNTDLSNDNTMIEKLNNSFIIPNEIIGLLKNGKTNDFSDFTKVYIVLSNIINDNTNNITCTDSNSSACIDEELVNSKAQDLFGENITINNKNYQEFNKYPFDFVTNSTASYDETKKMYIIKKFLSGHGTYNNDQYIKVPYKLLKSSDTYYFSYYLVYLDYGDDNCEDVCNDYSNNTYTYYTKDDKNKKIFVLSHDELNNYKNRIINSSIKTDFTTITLTLKENNNKINFVEYKKTN